MYLKKDEFLTIEKALQLINYNSLSDDEKRIALSADLSLFNAFKRYKESNKKTAAYIAKKRKIDKNYAR